MPRNGSGQAAGTGKCSIIRQAAAAPAVHHAPLPPNVCGPPRPQLDQHPASKPGCSAPSNPPLAVLLILNQILLINLQPVLVIRRLLLLPAAAAAAPRAGRSCRGTAGKRAGCCIAKSTAAQPGVLGSPPGSCSTAACPAARTVKDTDSMDASKAIRTGGLLKLFILLVLVVRGRGSPAAPPCRLLARRLLTAALLLAAGVSIGEGLARVGSEGQAAAVAAADGRRQTAAALEGLRRCSRNLPHFGHIP